MSYAFSPVVTTRFTPKSTIQCIQSKLEAERQLAVYSRTHDTGTLIADCAEARVRGWQRALNKAIDRAAASDA